ncbi:adhesin [Listeria monocytogenes]|uniref:metal ABC transporter substrate-binding protein n=1 Tax=Listeria marthii TaxID=529731 RepID=UPI0010B07826|nr:metal ABC transporter substrate-binding protein [Listeria marthii]EAC5051507.1 adhesin [Listeria monocytogenes]ECO7679922.1 zinc ABC transporter substrate-binding protein [Listeria monocytogenes]EHL5011940.1 zinc ABC transporter substrate-binding protein [Listeria monocytogenes]EKC4247345.1 zinc ABC transporter substrate-binding protein [Listeria monocytogenes]MBC2037848.1 zinc ABC transporter substrate-binding protein [Listeria marthii]
MKKSYLIALAALLSTLLILTGCSDSSDTKTNSDKLTVYTTVYPLQYLTEQIGGKYVDVHSIYPPGSDAHSFEPTQKDMMKIADSDLFFYIGLGMEGFVDKAEKTLANEHVTFAPTAEKLDLPTDPDAAEEHDHESEEEHEHGDINPHVWLNPVYMEQMATVVKDKLIKEMPDQKETFEKNYQAVEEKLKTLDQDFRTVTSEAKQKDFVTAHAAYSYWETEYKLHQIPIAGVSTSDEPSQKKLKSIVEKIEAEKIPYIMLEQNTNSKIADVIQQETNTKTLTLHNLETLTQKDIDNQRDYLSIMNDNLKALKEGLNY